MSPLRSESINPRPLPDDRVMHCCICGWEGRWDEAFAHVVETLSDEGHRIEDKGC